MSSFCCKSLSFSIWSVLCLYYNQFVYSKNEPKKNQTHFDFYCCWFDYRLYWQSDDRCQSKNYGTENLLNVWIVTSRFYDRFATVKCAPIKYVCMITCLILGFFHRPQKNPNAIHTNLLCSNMNMNLLLLLNWLKFSFNHNTKWSVANEQQKNNNNNNQRFLLLFILCVLCLCVVCSLKRTTTDPFNWSG